jgi:hypothetical protein
LKKKTLSVNILVHMSINFRNPKPTRLGWQKSSIQKFVLLQKAHSDRQAGSDCFHRHKKSDCNWRRQLHKNPSLKILRSFEPGIYAAVLW